MLVENKVDLLDDPKENEESLIEFTKQEDFCGCFLTSAKTGKNISESMEFLIKLIIERLKNMEDNNISNQNSRETLKLEPEENVRRGQRSGRCC